MQAGETLGSASLVPGRSVEVAVLLCGALEQRLVKVEMVSGGRPMPGAELLAVSLHGAVGRVARPCWVGTLAPGSWVSLTGLVSGLESSGWDVVVWGWWDWDAGLAGRRRELYRL